MSSITVTLSVTDATDAVSSTAAIGVSAALTVNDANDTLSATSAVDVVISTSISDAVDQISSTVTISAGGVSVSADILDDQDVVVATAIITPINIERYEYRGGVNEHDDWLQAIHQDDMEIIELTMMFLARAA